MKKVEKSDFFLDSLGKACKMSLSSYFTRLGRAQEAPRCARMHSPIPEHYFRSDALRELHFEPKRVSLYFKGLQVNGLKQVPRYA